jgi:hypothetical protein
MCAGRNEGGIGVDIAPRNIEPDPSTALDLHPLRPDPVDLLVEHVAWQAVFGDSHPKHAARFVGLLEDSHLVPHPGQVVGARESGRTRADDADAFGSGAWRGVGEWSVELEVAERALDRMNGDGLVEMPAVAVIFARMVAHPTGDGRHGVLSQQQVARFVHATLAQEVHVSLDVDPHGTAGITWGNAIVVDGTDVLPRPGGVHLGRCLAHCHGRNTPAGPSARGLVRHVWAPVFPSARRILRLPGPHGRSRRA